VKTFMREAGILIAIVTAIAVVVAIGVIHNPFKQPLPNAQMTELKAEPPIVKSPTEAIASGNISFSGPTCWTDNKNGGVTLHDCGYNEVFENQIRTLTKRIEELEKRQQDFVIPNNTPLQLAPSSKGVTVYCSSHETKDGIFLEDRPCSEAK